MQIEFFFVSTLPPKLMCAFRNLKKKFFQIFLIWTSEARIITPMNI